MIYISVLIVLNCRNHMSLLSVVPLTISLKFSFFLTYFFCFVKERISSIQFWCTAAGQKGLFLTQTRNLWFPLQLHNCFSCFVSKQTGLSNSPHSITLLTAGNPEPPDQLEGPWSDRLWRVGSWRNVSPAACQKWKNPLFVWQAPASYQKTRRNLHIQGSHPG